MRRHFTSDTVLEKMYQEIMGFLKKQGERYVTRYYLRGMALYLRSLGRKNLMGVEIGTANGTNARIMMEYLSIDKLFCVDPFIEYLDGDGIVKSTISNRSRAFKILNKYGSRVVFVEKMSDDAVPDIPSDLDFVCIDGNHSYDFVKADILNYYPKVKMGGVIGGHDYNGITNGVVKAVTEFASEMGLVVYFGRHDDWWMVKK